MLLFLPVILEVMWQARKKFTVAARLFLVGAVGTGGLGCLYWSGSKGGWLLMLVLGLMWVLLIVAETISAQSGIGYMTMNAREFLQTDVVLVGILLYALLGKLADVLAKGLERWWLRWHPGYQADART